MKYNIGKSLRKAIIESKKPCVTVARDLNTTPQQLNRWTIAENAKISNVFAFSEYFNMEITSFIDLGLTNER